MNEQGDMVEATHAEPKEIDRRQMLARLGATGLAGAGLVLSGGWRKPVVQAAYLPPHAQISPGPTATATTPPPVVHTIVSCDWIMDTRATAAIISPADPNISLGVQVYDLYSATPTVPVDSGTYLTDAAGQATHEYVLGGCPLLYMVWSFTNPADGTGTCTTANYEPPC